MSVTAAGVWAGVQVGGAVLGALGRGSANRQAAKAGKKQANMIRQTTAEAARRLERGQARQLGETTAGVYASGLEMGGSSEAYVQDMQAEQARELQWLKDAGEAQAKAAEKGASIGRQTGAWQNLGGLVSGVAGGYGTWHGGKKGDT